MIHKYSAWELSSLFLSKELSAVEIVKSTIERIEKHNKQLQAFLSILNHRSLEKAKLLDEKRKNKLPLGKLAGIPVGLKDNILLEGELTTCGSKFLTNYIAPYQSTVAKLLEEEDAIIIGKTNMDEFAMGSSGKHSAFSPTRNPWDLDCSPGGSSSGSAAAVAARLCPIAFGSDTGGSIRQPAALTGTTGFKPTYGRVSRYGLVAFGSSLDQIGPITQTVKECALVMECIGKFCTHDSTSIDAPFENFIDKLDQPLPCKRIGVPWNFLQQLQGDARKNFEKSLEILKDLGMEIIDLDLDFLKYGIAIYYIIANAEASTNLARFDGIRYGNRSKMAKTLDEIYEFSRKEGFGWEVKNRILLGTFVLTSDQKEAYYHKARKVRTLIVENFRKAFSKCDLIALPSTSSSAIRLDQMSDPLEEYLQDLYTVGASLAGLPAISIPSGTCSKGMPLGLQIMGPIMHDAHVLRLAHLFQSNTDFVSSPKFGEVS